VSNAQAWEPVPQPVPQTVPPSRLRGVPTVRLTSHHFRLADGHRMRASVAGRGMPLVVVHGFAAEGLIYAQTLSRLVSMGFKVITIDTAGHGGTATLPRDGLELAAYSRLLGRAIEELGIRRAVLAGHSMGGRLVTELAAEDPDKAVAVLLIDAIVGGPWDQMIAACRLWPPLLGVLGTAAFVDGLTTVSLDDGTQTAKLAKLLGRTVWNDVSKPWHLLGPFVSMLRSGASGPLLDRLAEAQVPVFVIHGSRDWVVPLATGRDAARRARGDLVVVQGAPHSWLLQDPETFAAIVGELLRGRLGAAYESALIDAGLDPASATTDDIEDAFYEPDAPVRALTPELSWARSERPRFPRFRWDHTEAPGT
jgi:pimeloyl-ACP methyl ester carboxylesterase